MGAQCIIRHLVPRHVPIELRQPIIGVRGRLGRVLENLVDVVGKGALLGAVTQTGWRAADVNLTHFSDQEDSLMNVRESCQPL